MPLLEYIDDDFDEDIPRASPAQRTTNSAMAQAQLPRFEGREEDFPVWLTQFSSALLLSDVTDKGKKRAMLLMSLSTSVIRTLIALCNQKDITTELEFDDLVTKLKQHYQTSPIQLAAYHKLLSLQMQAGQSPGDFASQIGQAAGYCEFPIDLPRTQAIVFAMGYRDDKVRSQLIQKDHKAMEPALEQARQLEALRKETARSSRPSNSTDLANVHQVRRGGAPTMTSSPCHRCGRTNHTGDTCRFKDETCRSCRKRGHISSVCRSASKQQQTQPSQQPQRTSFKKKEDGRKYHQQNRNNQVSVDFIKIGQIAEQTTPGQIADPKVYEAAIQVNGHNMLLEFDTGAAATIISEEVWRLLGKPPLKNTRLPLKDFSGKRLKLKGMATVDVVYKGKHAKLPIIVGPQCDSVIGRKWIRQLEMCNCTLNVKKNTIQESSIEALLKEFPAIFKEGLGHCTRIKAHLELKSEVCPKFIKARTLPFAVHDAVDTELDPLVAQRVLTPVTYAEWAAPVVIAPKSGGQI